VVLRTDGQKKAIRPRLARQHRFWPREGRPEVPRPIALESPFENHLTPVGLPPIEPLIPNELAVVAEAVLKAHLFYFKLKAVMGESLVLESPWHPRDGFIWL